MNAVARLRARVRGALEDAGLARGSLLVVAVSGGPDSLALLHALHSLTPDLAVRLHGAHLDHGLRGAASDADARFVAAEFRRLGLANTCERADVAAYRRERKLSLEEAARDIRYAFLARVAERQGGDTVALGHTADDQAETVLMRLLRGTGLTGLRGMSALSWRDYAGGSVALVRPLLGVTRSEVVAYCRELGLAPREDASNVSTDILRNRVRLELIPHLESYNPSVRRALLRLARTSARDLAYVEEQVDASMAAVASRTADGVALDRGAFTRLHPAIQAHTLRRAFAMCRGSNRDLEQYHVDAMARLIRGRAGTSLHLPGGVRFVVGYERALLSLGPRDSCPFPPLEGCHGLTIPGESWAGTWSVSATFAEETGPHETERPRRLADGPPFVSRLDATNVGTSPWLRARVPGERFQPLGMSHTKKLQDFMVDEKIPREWRDRVPLLVAPRGVAWVAGCRVAEWARPRQGGGRQFEVRIELGR